MHQAHVSLDLICLTLPPSEEGVDDIKEEQEEEQTDRSSSSDISHRVGSAPDVGMLINCVIVPSSDSDIQHSLNDVPVIKNLTVIRNMYKTTRKNRQISCFVVFLGSKLLLIFVALISTYFICV